ncbi:hypothetical protein [Noviherbaspirillum sp. Root189]|uniref:hypothetical protein n=1 Tax=Noviherbaspirillum sp. Root189 TaxID=1736487 RepID=UPI00070A3E4D|nr:hypothetical protein [Noviherbaspirillum sp. Root189]KRB93528.1 hypothetical protein ASE07_12555 [Noviherbaspirillum sp. Root189]
MGEMFIKVIDKFLLFFNDSFVLTALAMSGGVFMPDDTLFYNVLFAGNDKHLDNEKSLHIHLEMRPVQEIN